MFPMKSVNDLWNRIAYVLAYAPNNFPVEDFLRPDQQMNLSRAFESLRQGIEIAYPDISFAKKRQKLHELLDRSYAAYEVGENIRAGHLLNEFEANIFKN